MQNLNDAIFSAVLETPINSRFYSATYVNTGSMQPVSHFDLTPASEEKRFFVMAVHPTQDRAYPEVKYFRVCVREGVGLLCIIIYFSYFTAILLS